jgi:hypothetical protein
MRSNFKFQLIVATLVFLVCWVQPAFAQDAARKIIDSICIVIYLIQVSIGAIAVIVIILMGLKYLSSADDSDARYMARMGIISAFVGILIVVLAVPIVNVFASDLIGTVDCDFLQYVSGSFAPAGGSVTPGVKIKLEPKEKSADIAAKGFSLLKSPEEIKADGYKEFPLYFQLANDGTQSSPGFVSSVSMVSGIDYALLCNAPSAGLEPDGKILSYECKGADMAKVKQLMEGSDSVTLFLKVDSQGAVMDADRTNNELAMVLSDIPKKSVDDLSLGDPGGITINYVKEIP